MRTRLRPLPMAVVCLLAALSTQAQVRTDGSLGPAAQNLAGPTYAITESLGRRAGNNLFHSFQTFHIGRGETALFSTTTPSIANVIGRVTGGQVSSIDGTIRLQAAAGAPSLFLVNPAGVVFGAGAAIDVPGAFHVSTADSVRFPDGAFHANPGQASTFSSAPPEAFGFLGQARGAVVLHGATLSNGDAPLSITAGDVSLEGAASVRNRGGDVTIVAAGGRAVEIPLRGEVPASLEGSVRIEGGSLVATTASSGGVGGAVKVAAGQLDIDGGVGEMYTGIRTETDGADRAGDVSVRVAEHIRMDRNGTLGSYSSGRAGDVELVAGSVHMGDGSIYSRGDARGGNIDIQVAREARIIDGSIAGSGGHAGAVRVRADHLAVGDWGMISSSSTSGLAGVLEVTASQLDLVGSITSFQGGGALNVTVNDTLRIGDGPIGGSISSRGAPVRVQARRIEMDGGMMYRSPRVGVNGGDFSVVATDTLEMHRSSISAESYGGVHGPLSVTAGRLLMDNSRIYAEVMAGTGSDGSYGGDIRIAVDGEAHMRNGSAITSTLGRTATALDRASGIVLRAGELSVRDSLIESANESRRGHGGDISLNVDGALRVTRHADIGESGGEADFVGVKSTHMPSQFGGGTGTSGAVTIRTGQFSVEGSAQTRDFTGILTSSVGSAAGDIDVHARDGVSLQLATLRSHGQYGSDSGAVRVDAGTALLLHDATVNTETSGGHTAWGYGYAGDIELRASAIDLLGTAQGAVRISSSGTSARYASEDGIASASEGGAGTIRLIASGPVSLRGNSFISADGDSVDGTYGYADTAPDQGRTAGRIEMVGGSLLLDGMGEGRYVALSSITAGNGTGPWAQGGDIALRIAGPITMRHGVVLTASTFGRGDAGTVSIDADSMVMQHVGNYQTGISSFAGSSARGGAGRIVIRLAGDLQLRDGAHIDASAGLGAGGELDIEAANVTVAGTGLQSRQVDGTWQDVAISSRIGTIDIPGSPGLRGDVSVVARERILVEDGGIITMATQARPSAPVSRPGLLRLSASQVLVRRGSVDAFSIGSIPASNIQINAGNLVALDDGFITTSALGSAGGGGNIGITAPVLALNTGFVQANATATGASGGNISADVRALLSSHASLRVGGDTVADFEPGRAGANVIQAVAPTGVSGNIAIASPEIDLAGALAMVTADTLPQGALGKSPCQRNGGSSLGMAGRGGLPPSSAQPAGVNLAFTPGAPTLASVPQFAGRDGCRGG